MPNHDPTVIIGPDEYEDTASRRNRGPAGGGRQPTVNMSGDASYGYGPANANTNATVSLRHREPPTFAWLVILEGVHAGHIFRVNGDVTVIGRDTSCDVVLDDASVTRQHAKIRVEGEKETKSFLIFDLATENGTFVNDEEITKHTLEDDDRIVIGETKLVFKRVTV